MEKDILSRAWPEWKAVKELGRGSYGVVYEAVRMDHQVESRAAIKVISIPQNESEIDSLRSEGMTLDASKTYLRGVVDDFVSEIQMMESFKGIQNIVSVEDYKVIEKENQIGWDIFIRMELLTSFNKYICDKTLTEAEVIKLGCDICTALEFCAKRNVIHRDIKPENIFVNDFGDFKLGDFGIARKLESVTGGYSQKGTFNYMAPEVEKGTEYDARVDLYSLGLVLYRFMNKNRLPFLDTDRQLLNPNDRVEAVRRRMNGEALPLPRDASPDMAQAILCACAYDPRRRFSTATAMKTALLNVNGGMDYASRDDLNKTVSVRNAAGQAQEKTEATDLTDGTYDEEPNAGKRGDNKSDRTSRASTGGKKSKKRKIIVIVIIIVALAGAVAYVVPQYLGLGSVTDILSIGNNEAERIQEILDEAAALAESDDYDGALAVIRDGLEEYPDSEELLAKEEEYENEQAKAEILAKAEEYAASRKYAMALNLIKTQDGYEADADYQDAYSRYSESYKTEVLGTAEEKAEEGDYLAAINKITDAQKAVDEFETDDEIQAALTTYENQYVADVISQVDGYINAGDYDSAEAALAEALDLFPDNTKLQDEERVLEDSKVVMETSAVAEEQDFMSLCSPYQKSEYYETGTFTIMGESYYGFRYTSFLGGYAWYNLTKDLNGQYSTLSFDVGHIDESGNDSSSFQFYLGDNNDEVTEFYVDGEMVSELTLSPSMSIKHVEISIEDASKLIIEGGMDSDEYALINITVK